jgi:hypothetical protein
MRRQMSPSSVIKVDEEDENEEERVHQSQQKQQTMNQCESFNCNYHNETAMNEKKETLISLSAASIDNRQLHSHNKLSLTSPQFSSSSRTINHHQSSSSTTSSFLPLPLLDFIHHLHIGLFLISFLFSSYFF